MLAISSKNLSTKLFDPIFDELFNFSNVIPKVKTPVYDVIENDKEYQIQMLLAGIKKEDINIDTENDILKIKAERKEIKDLKYNHRETYFGKYESSFILPDDIDKENISATLEDGILKITIPKYENKISVNKKTIKIM